VHLAAAALAVFLVGIGIAPVVVAQPIPPPPPPPSFPRQPPETASAVTTAPVRPTTTRPLTLRPVPVDRAEDRLPVLAVAAGLVVLDTIVLVAVRARRVRATRR
jgi:hypothetical protein